MGSRLFVKSHVGGNLLLQRDAGIHERRVVVGWRRAKGLGRITGLSDDLLRPRRSRALQCPDQVVL